MVFDSASDNNAGQSSYSKSILVSYLRQFMYFMDNNAEERCNDKSSSRKHTVSTFQTFFVPSQCF